MFRANTFEAGASKTAIQTNSIRINKHFDRLGCLLKTLEMLMKGNIGDHSIPSLHPNDYSSASLYAFANC
jgi:hypothetical protein